MIDGEPGAGKTTFVKRLCYIWARGVLYAEEKEIDEYLHKYTLVIPIVLRLISKQNTLTDLFTSHLQCLKMLEICALVNFVKSEPKKLLLLLDGYDEYKGQSIISKVISKEECTNILTVTTSRPHAVEQLRRHTSEAIEQRVTLCGFSEEQVKKYIKQFCEHYIISQNARDELIKTLFEKRPDILRVAKIPIRTEMICIVWAVYGKLGKTIADLYELFVIHLITHWKTKQKMKQDFETKTISPRQVLIEHKSLLLKIGQLAYTWEKHNRLRIVFSTEELEVILGEDIEKGINIGILMKSHPSHILQESKWSFPHLTIQEFFVTFLFGNETNDTNTSSFVKRCTKHRVLRSCEVIFTFLCSKYPAVANKILTQLLLKEKDEQKCKELFGFICKVYPYFTQNTLNLPLPCYLNLKDSTETETDVHTINTLLESDKRRKQPNLRYLILHDPVKYERFLNVHYITGFSVTISNEDSKNLVTKQINKLLQMTSININSQISLQCTDNAGILKTIHCDRLTHLSVTAPGAMEVVADSIIRFTVLQELYVDETSRSDDNKHAYKILSVLQDNNSIKQASLCVPDLDKRILQEKIDMKVKLQVKEGTLKKGSLGNGVRGLDFTRGLFKLDLGFNNLKHDGDSLGQLMSRVTTLRVLCLYRCKIEADTLQAMVLAAKKTELMSDLRTLYMGRYGHYNDNNLQSGGCYLGELVALIPNLHTLDLDRCNLTDTDLASMSGCVPESINIHTLNLQGNDLGHDNSEGLVSLLRHTPLLKALAVGGDEKPAPISALCRASVDGSLPGLYALDMSLSKLLPGNLKKLSQQLQYQETIQLINLDLIDGMESEDYQTLYKNLPTSLQHLSLFKHSPLDIHLMLAYQHNLNRLLKLNIKMPDSDIELLQEVLEQHNPDIHVYNHGSEARSSWRMYVLDD